MKPVRCSIASTVRAAAPSDVPCAVPGALTRLLYPLSLLTLSLLAAHSVCAQTLDLKQAYEAALTEDANLKVARAAAVSGRERLPQAWSQLLPSLSLSVSRNRNKLETAAPNLFGQASNSLDRYFSGNETLTLRQPLLRMPQLMGYRQAGFQVADTDAQLEREVQNLAVRVSGAYFEALLAKDQLVLLSAQKTATTAQLDAAKKIFAAGAGTRTDIDEAQARLDMTLAQELEASQNVAYTAAQLQILVIQPFVDLAALDTTRLLLLPPVPDSVAAWEGMATQRSPEITALKARRETARLEIEKTKAAHYPTLDAVAQWSRSDSEYTNRLNYRYDTKSIGVQLSVPLYSGGYVDSTVRQALAELEKAEQSLEAGKRDLSLRVHKEYRGVTEGILKIRALEQAARSAEQALISSKKSYAAGVRTLIDTLNAEQQKRIAERDLAQARYLYLMSKIRLLALVGDADAEKISEINSALKTERQL